jgi:FkbM family methyltransferase
MRTWIKSTARRLPVLRQLVAARDQARADCARATAERDRLAAWAAELERALVAEAAGGSRWRLLTFSETIRFLITVAPDSTDGLTQEITAGRYPAILPWDLLGRFLRPGETVLDLGANIGLFTLPAAAQGCRVIAVEASPRNAALLRASVAANRFHEVTVIESAASDRPGWLSFYDSGPYGHVAAREGEGLVRVEAVVVDDLLGRLGVERVGFVKMDIEGSEVVALRGLRGLLTGSAPPPLFLESNGYALGFGGATCADLRATLREVGYTPYQVGDGRLIPVGLDDLQPEVCIDLLAVPTGTAAGLGWPLVEPPTPAEVRAQVLAALAHPNGAQRIHIACELRRAPAWLRNDPEVSAGLAKLRDDPFPQVRDAAA